MYALTPAQLAMLYGNHQMSLRVSLFRGSESLGDIQVSDATVSATYGTQGGREATLYVDRSLLDAGLLNPLSDQVIIRTGVKGQFEVPIFTGRVDESRIDEVDGAVVTPLISRGVEAVRAPFLVPWSAVPGSQARYEIARILQNVDPTWAVEVGAASAAVIPPNLVWETDRGEACDQLAQGASLIWQPDRTGGFVVYTNPYLVGPSLGAGITVFLTDGQNGTSVQVTNTLGRQGIFNAVTVITERVNNTEPIRVTAMDTDPASPTYWGGVFGKQNRVVKNQTPMSVGESGQLALRILRQSLASQRYFQITTSHLPVLDPGDVFALTSAGVTYTLVCEGVTYSCSADAPTSITARELLLQEGLTLV